MASSNDRPEILDTLAAGISRLTNSAEWKSWLDVQRRFHRYSFGNTLLIALQRPDATQVAGFRAWLGMGRHVRKGEKGIAIIAPVVSRLRVKDEETGTESVITGSPKAFRLAYVFDVSQTDGAALPEVPLSKLQGEDPDGLYTKLRGVANSIGFTVDEECLDGGTNGYCDSTQHYIRIEVRSEPRQQLKTLAHELAHAILHESRDGLTRERAELEAESVAYMVCADLGVDSGDYTFGYVATWAGGGDEAITALKASAQRIQRAAAQILDLLGAGGAEQGAEAAVAA
jgi:antirestriction protein ArdC